MASPNDFPGAKKGDRLTVGNIRRWISGANRGSQRRLDVIESPSQGTLLEPAAKVFAINTSSTNIPAGAPVSLERVTDVSTAGLFNARCFNVVLLESATTAPINAGVAVDLIPYGEAGEIYISGVCLARLTDANDDLLPASGLSTLWQESTTGNRWAMVRFGGTAVIPALFNSLGSDTLTTVIATAFSGVGLPGTVPTVLPQASPAALVTFPAYLGKARFGTKDTGTWVWISTKVNPGTGAVSDTLTSIPNGTDFLSRTSVLMPITASSALARVYLPWDF